MIAPMAEIGRAFAVGVLDAQQHFSRPLTREQPVEQSGARAADVDSRVGEGAKRVTTEWDMDRDLLGRKPVAARGSGRIGAWRGGGAFV